MKIAEIGESVRQLVLAPNRDRFLYELLAAYGQPKASITRLESKDKGSYNLSKVEGVVLWKKKVLYASTALDDVESYAEALIESQAVEKHSPRFVVVTNFERFYVLDTKTDETLDILFVELPKHFDFLLPWANMEKATVTLDNPADVKAAEKMAKLFDLIKADNPSSDPASVHSLNVFLSRLLFCYFAEDTGIFKRKLFTNKIESQTSRDGSDVSSYLDLLFDVLNTEDKASWPSYLHEFEYVNGGLFADKHPTPRFTAKSRQILIECGAELDWSEINPDIFGSMIQAVVDVKKRGKMGMHYTNVQNIMKVIKPLFLDALYADFEKSRGSTKKLLELQKRITEMKFFDPACGSGNFLIIAYKEIRRLEMEIFNQISLHERQADFGITGVQLSQFYGIELDDFAHEIAILALWLAEHQMNVAFTNRFGGYKPTLPLKPSGNIFHGNALEIDWTQICARHPKEEVFLMGNPPYYGAKKQTKEQKADIARVFQQTKTYRNLDYISCWFMLGARYVSGTDARAGFVTTNSIVQGEQVGLLWPSVFELGVVIPFAHEAFKWENNAKNKAGVTCVVVGLSSDDVKERWLYSQDQKTLCKNISPYLTDASNAIIFKRSTPLSNIAEMVYGNMPLDGGFLKLEPEQLSELLQEFPQAKKFIRPLIGGNELLYDEKRWCIWIEDDQLAEAELIPPIKKRIQQVRDFRINGGEVAQTLVNRSHQFRYRQMATRGILVVPCTSSERREYLQVGFVGAENVSMNSAQVIYDPEPFSLGLVSSRMHMLWTKAACGALDSRIRYSNLLSYNNFPFPSIGLEKRREITALSLQILDERERNAEMTLAEMYDPKRMPPGLKKAHGNLDVAIESVYRREPFKNDSERLAHLFHLFEQMKAKNNA